MSDLLKTAIEAHGGLARWNKLETVSARLTQGGALWTLKGQPGVLDDVFVTASRTRNGRRTTPSVHTTGGARLPLL